MWRRDDYMVLSGRIKVATFIRPGYYSPGAASISGNEIEAYRGMHRDSSILRGRRWKGKGKEKGEFEGARERS